MDEVKGKDSGGRHAAVWEKSEESIGGEDGAEGVDDVDTVVEEAEEEARGEEESVTNG